MKKNTITRITAICMIALMIFSVVGCSNGTKQSNSTTDVNTSEAGNNASDEVITMRLATSVQKDHPMNLAALEFARLVNEKSHGRIKVDVYAARQLGQDNEVAEMVMQGSLDMVEISSIMFSNYTNLVNAWQIPFLFSDMEQYRKTIKSEANKNLLNSISDLNLGIKALAIYNTGFRHIVVNGDDVQSVGDMKNIKIRTAESDMFLDMFNAIGAAPTPMAYGEVYSGLQNKVIDACEADFSAIYLEKFFEVSKSMTELKHFMWPGLLAINQDRFNSFSAEDQQIILEAAEEAIDYNVDNIIESEDKYRNLLVEAGFKVNSLSDEGVKDFNKAVAPVVEKYSKLDPLIAAFVAEAQANK